MPGIGVGRFGRLSGFGERVAQGTPGARMIGLEFGDASERGNGGIVFAQFAEQQTEFELDGGELWLGLGLEFEHGACAGHVALGAPGADEQHQRVLLGWNGFEDGACSPLGQRRIGGKQLRRAGERAGEGVGAGLFHLVLVRIPIKLNHKKLVIPGERGNAARGKGTQELQPRQCSWRSHHLGSLPSPRGRAARRE